MCLWLHQKGCAHWTVKSKINSAWQGFYLCVFSDKPSQIDRKGVIILALLLQRCHTQNPSNDLVPFPTLSPSRQPRSSVCSHRHGFTAPQNQPHKPRVSPDYRKQKTLGLLQQDVGGTESTDPRAMQWDQTEHTECHCCRHRGAMELLPSPQGHGACGWWLCHSPQYCPGTLLGASPLPSTSLGHQGSCFWKQVRV